MTKYTEADSIGFQKLFTSFLLGCPTIGAYSDDMNFLSTMSINQSNSSVHSS